MSRAFVKESDGEDEELPPRAPRVQPCYITRGGLVARQRELEQLQRELAAAGAGEDFAQKAEIRRLKIRRRDLVALLEEAVPVDVGSPALADVRFGATVELLDEDDRRWTFTIVGEDETDPERGRISWISPLARALIGHAPGDTVVWPRPQGALELEIVGLRYEAEPDASA
ncbi:MAG: GreA/GreB family elongation factor [Gammaproteobacteria bacterium]|nr:GreA/GreB family elongation factor [Gammaproteobacteria bacterium]MBI5615296.1 GreA/GreB family elongation factor [Gammaproteobacteria bacterium]